MIKNILHRETCYRKNKNRTGICRRPENLTGNLPHQKADIEGCIISSVVPQITNIARLAAEKILKKEVMVLGPGVKTGLNIMMDNPGQLGADLVADAVAGLNEYPVPFIVIDMGTATTVSVVNSKSNTLAE